MILCEEQDENRVEKDKEEQERARQSMTGAAKKRVSIRIQ